MRLPGIVCTRVAESADELLHEPGGFQYCGADVGYEWDSVRVRGTFRGETINAHFATCYPFAALRWLRLLGVVYAPGAP